MKKTILLAFVCLFVFQIQSQEFSPMKAPDVIAFTNANYMPIDESTGRVNITVPIYTINLDGMEIPISISYDTGGVKVNAPASNVGLNWSLNGVGLINKEIQGYEDTGLKTMFNDNATNGSINIQYGFLRHLLTFTTFSSSYYTPEPFKDTKPDLYYVMAPGLSTQFIHKNDGTAFELSNTGTKISSPFMNPYYKLNPYYRFGLKPGFNFKLISTNGFEYSFEDYGFHYSNELDNVYTGPLLDVNMTVQEFEDTFYSGNLLLTQDVPDLFPTIHLSSIKNPLSKKKVEYIYEDNLIVENNRHINGAFSQNGEYMYRQFLTDFTIEKTIKKIIYPRGVINFYYKDNRLDVRAGKILKKIEILNNFGELIKATVFEQDYFNSVENCTENHCYRLRLNRIIFLDKDNNTLPGYTFEYNTTKLPKRFSLNQDFTGYYNGQSNISYTQHYPKSYFKSGEEKNSIIPFPFPGYSLINPNSNVDKTPDLLYSRATSLEKVTYPTGGYTLFDYELHSFNFKNTSIKAGGLRLKKQSIFSMNNVLEKEINYNYSLESGLTSGSITNIPKYINSHYATSSGSTDPYYGGSTSQMINTKLELTNGSFINYSRIKSSETGNGYIVNEYTNAFDYPNERPTDFSYHPVNSTTLPSFASENIEQGFWPVSFVDNYIERGQLISSNVFDNQNNLLKQTINIYENSIYDYFNLIENNITSMPNFTYSNGSNAKHVRFQIPIQSKVNFLKKTTVKDYTDDGILTKEKINWYDSNLPFLKESQTTINDTETRKEINYYPFDSDVSSLPNVTTLNNLNILTPIKKQYFKNNELLATSLTSYHNFGANKIVPSKLSTSKASNALEVKVNFNRYDKRGNILEYKKEDGIIISTLWGYDYQYKIAEILNADYDAVLAALGVSDTKYLQTKTNPQLDVELTRLRTNLSNAQVYSYIHTPGVGVLSITDPRGRKNSYAYDSFKRLISIKDHDGNVLTENKYNYKLKPSLNVPNIGALTVAIKKSSTPDYLPDPAPTIQYTVLSAMTTGGRGDYSYQWREEGASEIISTAYKYTAEVPCSTNKTYTVRVNDLNGTTITETVTVNAPICGEAFYVSPILGQSTNNNTGGFWVDIEGGNFGTFLYLTYAGDISTTTYQGDYESFFNPRNNSGNPVNTNLHFKVTELSSGNFVYRSRYVTIQPEFEINSCFVAGTKIKMANGSEKNIEAVINGDKVLTYNTENKEIETGEVINMVNPEHTKLIKFSFENGTKNTNTLDHPYYIKDKGWASFSPRLTKRNYDLEVKQIEVGDIVFIYTSKEEKLKSIKLIKYELIHKKQTTYNLDKVSKNHNFFANGILVHNKSSFRITNYKN